MNRNSHGNARLLSSPPSQHNEADPMFYGWRVVLASVIGLLFSPGPMFLMLVGALAPVYEHAYGWSIGRVMFGMTLFGVASVLAAPVIGWLADRYGVRRIMLPSILASSACLVIFGTLVSTLTQFYVVCFLFGFLGFGAQSLTFNKLLTEWFNERRGLAIGIASAGLGLGYVVLPGVIAFGMGHYGTNGTFFLLAGLTLVLPFAINYLCAVSPTRMTMQPVPALAKGLSLAQAAKTRSFWLLACAILVTSAIVTGMVPQISKLTRDLGYAKSAVTQTLTVFGIVTLCVRLLIGWLLDRSFAPRIGAIAFLLTAVGCAAVAACVYTTLPPQILTAGVALVGLGYGTESDLISYLTSKYFGKRHFGSIYGCLLMLFLCGVSIGPFMYGFARSTLGNYSVIFLIAAALAVFSACLMLCLPAYPALSRPLDDGSAPDKGALQI